MNWNRNSADCVEDAIRELRLLCQSRMGLFPGSRMYHDRWSNLREWHYDWIRWATMNPRSYVYPFLMVIDENTIRKSVVELVEYFERSGVPKMSDENRARFFAGYLIKTPAFALDQVKRRASAGMPPSFYFTAKAVVGLALVRSWLAYDEQVDLTVPERIAS